VQVDHDRVRIGATAPGPTGIDQPARRPYLIRWRTAGEYGPVGPSCRRGKKKTPRGFV